LKLSKGHCEHALHIETPAIQKTGQMAIGRRTGKSVQDSAAQTSMVSVALGVKAARTHKHGNQSPRPGSALLGWLEVKIWGRGEG